MLEPELCSSRILSPFREESGDEELSVLPRHTKVIVTGNNRTKSVLVGLQGVVKKAVGLGGWHWLVFLYTPSSSVLCNDVIVISFVDLFLPYFILSHDDENHKLKILVSQKLH